MVVGLGIKFSSGGTTGGCPTFNTSQCYEITDASPGFHNCQGIIDVVSGSCGLLSGCGAPTPTPTPSPIPVPTVAPSPVPSPTPAPVVSTYYYVISNCDGSGTGFTEVASTSVLSPGTSVKMSDGVCYEVEDAVAPINSNVPLSSQFDIT